MLKRYSILLVAVGLAACSTPYQEMGLLGGVSATRIDDNTIQISGKGNAYTSAATIQQYVLLKAADETLADGYDFFVLVSASDASRSGAFYVPGQTTSYTTGSASIMGNNVYGQATTHTYATPGSAFIFIKPGEDAVIKMYRGVKPADAPPNVYDAYQVEQYLGAQIKQPK
ncbi:MAG: CC0125/CC1285 family lipoprotein [Rhizomicrobium sp.]